MVGVGILCPKSASTGVWMARTDANPAQRGWETFSLVYGVFWISCFAVIIGGRMYEWFDREQYFLVCGGLATPLWLQALFFTGGKDEQGTPWYQRYAFKANVWVAIFGFIGNYWYTHYFYNVLEASYTMPSWDINGVPIPMFFATHFYFCFYHVLSNMAIRKAWSSLAPGAMRSLFVALLVLVMSYVTAFMESLTISGFPCYDFRDRDTAYTLGSAFYGIYFIVSFPMFSRLDDKTLLSTAVIESLATGMAVLCLLDFVRVGLGQDLIFKLNRPCKLDASLTCAPFNFKTC